jgi:hypothetical protein
MKHIKLSILASILFMALGNDVVAQYSEENPNRDSTSHNKFLPEDFKDKLSFCFQVGVPIFGIPPIDLGAQLGYSLHEKLTAGLQFNFVSTPISGGGNKFYTYYGPSLFARGFFTSNVFLTAEAGIMNMPYFPVINTQNPEIKRTWDKLVLVGFGYKRGVFGDNSYTYASILYQVMPSSDSNSPYFAPLVLKSGIVF